MTKLANAEGRAVLLVEDRLVDVERRSDGRFPSDPMIVNMGAKRNVGGGLRQ
jgi:hypothetical protein